MSVPGDPNLYERIYERLVMQESANLLTLCPSNRRTRLEQIKKLAYDAWAVWLVYFPPDED